MSNTTENWSFNTELDKAYRLYLKRQLGEALEIADAIKSRLEHTNEPEQLIKTNLLLSGIHGTKGRYLGDPSKLKFAQSLILEAQAVADRHQTTGLFPLIQRALAQAYLSNKELENTEAAFQKLIENNLNKNTKYQILGLIGLSENATLKNEFDTALQLATEAQTLLHQRHLVNPSTALKVYNQLSQVYFKLQEYEPMLTYSQKVLELSEPKNDVERTINALKNIAIYHAAKAEYKEAMQYFLESMNKGRAINHRVHTAQCLINIATIYASLYNHADAIARYRMLLEEYSEVISPNTRVAVYNNLGNIYYTSDQYNLAIQYFGMAYTLASELNYDEMVILALANLSRTNIAKDNIETATQQANAAQKLIATQGDINGRQINLLNLGHLNYLNQEYDKALELTDQGITAAKRMKDDSNEVRGYQLMSDIYQKQEDFKTALDYQIRYSNAQNKFSKKQRNRQIIDLEIKNAIREKQQEIEQLTKENQYQALLLKQSDQIAEQNAQLMSVNDELRQFAYVTSHDLKEPIRMIGSYTQLIERKHAHQFTEDSQAYFTYVKEGVHRMNDLLDALLRYTTINRTEDKFEKVALIDVVDLAIINLRVRIQENNAVIDRHDLPSISSIKSLLIQLFQNLISNAIKFKKPAIDPVITVTYEETETEVIVQVADNGIGIAPEYQERIFVIFQRLHARSEYEGTGIGLAICQKIVQRLGGRIWVTSEPGQGANFFVAFPKGG